MVLFYVLHALTPVEHVTLSAVSHARTQTRPVVLALAHSRTLSASHAPAIALLVTQVVASPAMVVTHLVVPAPRSITALDVSLVTLLAIPATLKVVSAAVLVTTVAQTTDT